MTELIEYWNYLLSFSPMRIVAVIADFAIITVLIYGLLYFLRGTRSANVLFGITAFLVISALLANLLHLTVIETLLSGLWPILGTAIIVIFQPEIRRFFAEAGTMFANTTKWKRETSSNQIADTVGEVVNAAVQMSHSKTGALIVFERKIGLQSLVKTSIQLDVKVSSLLLQSIFFKNSPLHDCSVIIRGNKIVAARAVLPLTQEDPQNPARRLGTRHRAAVGITEETDAIALVVSEETGTISVARKGRLIRNCTSEELNNLLNTLLLEKSSSAPAIRQTSSQEQPDLFTPEGNEK